MLVFTSSFSVTASTTKSTFFMLCRSQWQQQGVGKELFAHPPAGRRAVTAMWLHQGPQHNLASTNGHGSLMLYRHCRWRVAHHAYACLQLVVGWPVLEQASIGWGKGGSDACQRQTNSTQD